MTNHALERALNDPTNKWVWYEVAKSGLALDEALRELVKTGGN